MRRHRIWREGLGMLIAGAALAPLDGRGADHIDSPAAMMDPAADITDVYAWTNTDATKVNLVLNWAHNVSATAMFSEAVVYVLHVTSMPSYGSGDKKETQVICKFYSKTQIECWAGGEYASGDVTASTPIESTSKKLRVWAGRRNDPFFFELTGFQEAVKKVVAAAPSLQKDANGCPTVDAATSTLLVKQLQSSGAISSVNESKPATNTFAGLNVFSLAVQIDKSLVTEKGQLLGVWASTHRAQ